MNLVHAPTFRLNSALFVAVSALSVFLGARMPERYPVHFDLAGTPTRWEEGSVGMWVLIAALFWISFGMLHLFQRYLITDPDSKLLNVPHKKLFRRLPTELKVRVLVRANRLLGLINTGALLLWALLMLMIYLVARSPESPAALFTYYGVLSVIGLLLIVPLVEIVAIRRMIGRMARGGGPPGGGGGVSDA